MYAVTSVWKFGSPEQMDEAVRRFRRDFSSLIGAQPGLQSWYLAVTGADEALTVAIWASGDAYEAAQPELATWGQEHLADLDARVQQRRRGDLAIYVYNVGGHDGG